MIKINELEYKQYVDTYFTINKINNDVPIEIFFLNTQDYIKELMLKFEQTEDEKNIDALESDGYVFYIEGTTYLYIRVMDGNFTGQTLQVLYHELSHIFFKPDFSTLIETELTDEEYEKAMYGYDFFHEFYADYYSYKTIIKSEYNSIKFLNDLEMFIKYTFDQIESIEQEEDGIYNILFAYSSYLGLYEAMRECNQKLRFKDEIISFKTSETFIYPFFSDYPFLRKLKNVVEYVIEYNQKIDLPLLVSIYDEYQLINE